MQFSYDTCIPYFEFLDAMSTRGISILHIDTGANLRWNDGFDFSKSHRTDCRGNLSFVTNVDAIKSEVEDWSWNGVRTSAPRSTEDINEVEFLNLLWLCRLHADTEHQG